MLILSIYTYSGFNPIIMATLKQIDDFFAAEPVAIAGVSRNPKKFGYMVFKELKKKGLNVIPVNPNAGEILGIKAYHDVGSLPAGVKTLLVITNKKMTANVVREAINRGFKHIWIQQMSESKEALKELEGSYVNSITGECILMYYKPSGFHKFHRFLKKIFGRLPG